MFDINVVRTFNDDEAVMDQLINMQISYDGNKYLLVGDFDSGTDEMDYPIVKALAIMVGDEPDEYGYVDMYDIEWDVRIDYKGDSMFGLCDWQNPARVEPNGERIFFHEFEV